VGAAPAVLGLHGLIGNRAVAQLMRAPSEGGPAARAHPRHNRVYVTMTGEKLGEMTGDVTVKGREGQIEAEGFSMGVNAPTDVGTTEPIGKRQYSELEFRKGFDGASPLLFQALTTNERLTEVKFEFVHGTAGGADRVFQVIKLTNARLVTVRQSTDDAGDDVEIVRLRFQTIAFENTERNRTATDTVAAGG
jgi:type VI secretion system secreted protein Hcp